IHGTKKAHFKLIEDALTQVMDTIPSEFIHTGGAEAPKDEWKKSSIAQNFIKENKIKDEHELQSWFTNRVGAFLKKHGRRLIGWDEILEGGGLAQDAIVMSWRGEKGGITAAKAGHDVIMTPNSYLYIDYLQSKDVVSEPLSIGGFVSLDKVYSYNPRPAALTQEQQKHILGVQANL